MRILGVMSGSSLDGLDVASVIFDHKSNLCWEMEYSETFTIPEDLKGQLRNILSKNAMEISHTESMYSHFVGQCVNEVKTKLDKPVDYLSIHGHTLLHLTEIGTSWQLLNGGSVAAQCQTDVICDFRNSDMRLGGQGTPMAVIADRDLFEGYDFFINLGGIANISYVKDGKWRAYDFAPCNQVNDYYAQKQGFSFDKNGIIAASGHVNKKLLHALLDHPFIKKKQPKSLDNSWIKEVWLPLMDANELSVEDTLCTYSAFLAETIKKETSFKNGKILLTGGGAKNKYFIKILESLLSHEYECVIPSEEIIDFKESILMAYMAYLRVSKQPNFIGSATGAHRDTIGGAWYAYNK